MDKTNDKRAASIGARQNKDKERVLQELKKIPIVQVTCERSGISRATYYRWRNEDEIFLEAADAAINEGVLFINDMSESQLISLIKDKKWEALRFWLTAHHPKYANKLKITSDPITKILKEIQDDEQPLTKKE